MSEIPKNTTEDREFKKSTKIAAGIIGGLMVTSIVGGAIERNIREENRVHSVTEEYEHNQNILDEIESKSQQYVDASKDDMVAYLPISEGRTLYEDALSLIPDSLEDSEFVQFTILESSKSNANYQPTSIFAITKEKIDGEDTLLVRPIDASVLNTEIADPETGLFTSSLDSED